MKFLQQLFGTTKTDTTPAPSAESEHINLEMYKKSADLSARNKTLSLLQKINEIILSSITRLNEVAQFIATVLVKEAAFENVSIFIFSRKDWSLQRIGFSEVEKPIQINYFQNIPLSDTQNLLVQAVSKKTRYHGVSPSGILLSNEEYEKQDVKEYLGRIKSVHVFPLVIRESLLGAFVVSLAEEDQFISEDTRDLLNRLADIVGIGIDNALLYNEVQEKNKKLIRLDQLKDEFVSVASHELRTPMTAIKSYLWMTLDGRAGAISEKQKFYLNRAYSSVDRLIRLVNDMLNVSRIDSGRITLELSGVDLQSTVKEVFDEVMPRAQELGLSLNLLPSPNLAKVLADKDKIKEVLFNLIGNSLKFTPKGGAVSVSFAQKTDFIEITVSDTGTGVLQEDLPKLFQKFSMIDGSFSSDKAIQGTGLGLYISKSIVELHRGKIWAASQGRDKGSQFAFSLPVFHESDLHPSSKSQNEKQTVDIIHTEI